MKSPLVQKCVSCGWFSTPTVRARWKVCPFCKGHLERVERVANTVTSPLCAAALKYLSSGWSVIPVGEDKKPLVRWWKLYQERLPTEGEVRGPSGITFLHVYQMALFVCSLQKALSKKAVKP